MSGGGDTVRFGVFEADLQARELRKQGVRIKLRDQPFQILSLLLARPGQVVSRDELRKTLWPADTFVDFDHGLNRAINLLRDVLGDSADSPRFIETLPKRGYRFVAPVHAGQPGSARDDYPLLNESGNHNGNVAGDSLNPVTDLTARGRSAAESISPVISDNLIPQARQKSQLPWVIAGLSVITAIGTGTLWWRTTRQPDRPLVRFTDDLGPEAITGIASLMSVFSPVISPDGRRVLFPVQGEAGKHRLAMRLLDQSATSVLAGTEGAVDPFFSPDGQWIGFFAEQKMKKVSLQSGAAVTLCDTPGVPGGGAWGQDGTIVANLDFYHLFRVGSDGGRPQIVGKPEEHGELSWRWPQILPDGDKVLFTGASAVVGAVFDNANIEVLSLSTGEVRIVQRGGYFGRYLPSGHLLYIHSGTLLAVPFDPTRLETRGTPMPVLEDVADEPGTGAGRFDFSRTGTLVYFSSKGPAVLVPPSWIDSTGKIDRILDTPAQAEAPRLSADGRRLAMTVGGDLLVYDLLRKAVTKLTFNAALNRRPIWTPDGKHIVFSSDTPSSDGEYVIWWIRADGSSKPEKLFAEKTPLQPWSISPDGRRLGFIRTASDRNFEIWILALDLADPDHAKPGEPQPFPREPGGQVDPTFSPDGKWIAYSSVNLVESQVFVRPFPSTSSAARWPISQGSGRFPIWSRSGRELFYLDHSNRIMVVPYSVTNDSFSAGKPRLWSPVPIFRPVNRSLWSFDLAPDGKRFVALAKSGAKGQNNATVHMTVLLNFFDELWRRWPQSGK